MASLMTAPQDSLLNVQDEYVQAATANNTRLSYWSGIKHFMEHGGELPATAAVVVQYLKSYATIHNPRTIEQRLVHLR